MGKPEYRILIIDDEPDLLEILSYNLKNEGYSVFTAANGKVGIECAVKCQPHLIIIDMMMPEMDGVETCEHIRSIKSLRNTSVAFLSARSEDYSQVAGFNAGADDYMTKPVKMKVFLARVRALLKRNTEIAGEPHKEISGTSNTARPKPSGIEIDREKYSVVVEEKELFLPKKEFNLLLLISSKPGKVFTREAIFSHIWGDNVIVSGRTIDVHIRKLREKIGNNRIVTIKGVGYKYVE